jgi:hypothetical protein
MPGRNSLRGRRIRSYIRRRRRTGTFSPLQIASLLGWYVADDLGATLSDGGSVITWQDRGPFDFDLDRGSVGASPTYQTEELNGHAVVRFVTDDYLISSVGDYTALDGSDKPYSVFTVFKTSDDSKRQDIVTFLQNGSAVEMIIAQRYIEAGTVGRTFNLKRDDASTLVTLATTQVIAEGTYAMVSVVDTGTTVSIWHDGVATSIADTASNVGNIDINQLVVGLWPADVNYFYGDLAELVIFSEALSTADRQKVELYLRSKYGLP